VSNAAIYYKIWICVILGGFGGFIFVGTSEVCRKFKIDDPLHIFQVHGVPAFVGLVMIVLFDDKQGIFFTDIHLLVNE
jgi:ammonia channel protein AmtB